MRRATSGVHVRRRDLFRYADFRRAMSAQFSSQIADALTTITLANVLVFKFSDGPSLTAMASTLIVSLIPLILVGPIAGDLTDRFDRVKLLSRGHLARAAFTASAVFATIDFFRGEESSATCAFAFFSASPEFFTRHERHHFHFLYADTNLSRPIQVH